MVKKGTLAFLAITCIFWSLKGGIDKRCGRESRITDDEAHILLYVIPDAVYARTKGTDVDIMGSPMAGTNPNYPEADYFVGVLLARNEKITPLENGIIGYFAVDRRTASITTMSDFTEVKGKELARVQEWMRHEHNIQTK